MKKDVDEWLGRVEEGLREVGNQSFVSQGGEQSMEGSQLIGKYNDILR